MQKAWPRVHLTRYCPVQSVQPMCNKIMRVFSRIKEMDFPVLNVSLFRAIVVTLCVCVCVHACMRIRVCICLFSVYCGKNKIL